VQADQAIEALLRQIEHQVTAGRIMAPADDNALSTWGRVLDALSPDSPGALRALTDFVANMRRHAADEQAAGQYVMATDFLVFADQTTELLQRRGMAPVAAPVDASPALASSALSRDTPLTAFSGGTASPNSGPSEAPDGADSALVDSRSSGGGLAQGRMPAGDTAVAGSMSKEAIFQAPVVGKPAAGSTVLAGRLATPEPAAAFTSRGDAMLAIKDISAARKFYEYAANAGSARAAVALAETYDPGFINQLGTWGIRPNPVMAADWYGKAAALGNQVAVVRLKALRLEATR
jgi:hypothetical protein